jgi:NAD+ kinase
MKFGVTANPDIDHAFRVAKDVVAKLEKEHDVVLETELADALGRPGQSLRDMDVDVVIGVGGDGTVLRALQHTDAVVLGVNSGSLGFLLQVTAEEVDAALARLVRRDYEVEERLRLRVDVDDERLPDCTNEAVIHTAHVAKIRHFVVKVDGVTVGTVRADGVIVATPTGSTSYALSTGGPIVDPRVEGFVVTAIAPFKPAARPFVFPAAGRIEVGLARPKACLLVLDGQYERPLTGEERLAFTASERRGRFVRLRDDFYERLRDKLMRQG